MAIPLIGRKAKADIPERGNVPETAIDGDVLREKLTAAAKAGCDTRSDALTILKQTRDEAMARGVGARKGLHRILAEFSGLGAGQEARERPEGYGALSRARRAQNPGVVIARAAAAGEIDHLEDVYARLFVGIPG